MIKILILKSLKYYKNNEKKLKLLNIRVKEL